MQRPPLTECGHKGFTPLLSLRKARMVIVTFEMSTGATMGPMPVQNWLIVSFVTSAWLCVVRSAMVLPATTRRRCAEYQLAISTVPK